MKSLYKILAGSIAGLAATCGTALAAPNFLPMAVPEPDSIALVVLGIAGVMYFSRKGRK